MDIMTASETESASPESKDHDFWDHLRRIHFFIVAASVVLALGALAREEGRLFTAYQSVLEIDSLASKTLPNIDSLKAATLMAQAPDTLLVFNEAATTGPLWDSIHPRYRITIPRKVLFFRDPARPSAFVETAPRPSRDTLRTLNQWAAVWNRFGSERACRLVPALYPVNAKDPVSSGPAQLYGRTPDARQRTEPRQELIGSYVADTLDDGMSARILAGEPVAAGSPGDTLRLGHTASVEIEITCSPRPLEAQPRLAALARAQWQPGTYEQSFADLDYFFGDAERVPLSEATAFLKGRIENGSADVQVVGIPLPSRLLVSGGFALLIGLQLYFLLHLRAILRRCHVNAPAPEIAWIGAYDDLVSWFCYTASVCALPLFSGAVLLATALKRSHHSQWQNEVAFALQAVLCVATLFHHPRNQCDTEYRRVFRRARQIIRDGFTSSSTAGSAQPEPDDAAEEAGNARAPAGGPGDEPPANRAGPPSHPDGVSVPTVFSAPG
ncbi:MAG TPA: hypothetical protein VF705_12420, partial [Longimicrobium sp.]